MLLNILSMKNLCALLFVCISFSSFSQEHDFGWISGRWVGPGFGGTFEEVWSEPDSNGDLMGMFRYFDSEGKVQFYEFWILNETGLKLRHFNDDFTAWEEKAEFIDFSMIESSKNKITLKGLTYELIAADEVEIHLDMKHGEEVKTEVFRLKKQE
ncbi:MAG: hypothetical protein CMP48_14300 [Rickettsiales bacterium]|nr:hypothetical protein [Rickettsiales bacterium]